MSSSHMNTCTQLFEAGYPQVLLLHLLPSADMVQSYLDACQDHITSLTSSPHPNAGFDLITADCQYTNHRYTLDTGVACAATMLYADGRSHPTSFLLVPRSSIATRHAMVLGNSIGIIDAGYRGTVRGVFHPLIQPSTTPVVGHRHLQVCAPQLCPVIPSVVDSLDDTARGTRGFGSSGL